MCPVDFSDASERALNNSMKVARKTGAKLHVVNVYEPIDGAFSPRLNIDFEEENKEMKKHNDEQFRKLIANLNFTDIDYTTYQFTGEPEAVLLDFAAKKDIHLIFMGTTGKSYIERMMIGSVSENIAQKLPCSLVTTKSEGLLNLKLSSDIYQIEKLFNDAKELEATGYYEEALDAYRKCLNVSDMHIPALSALYKLYKKLDDVENAKFYSDSLNDILRKLWDKQIEHEIRNHFKL